MAYKVIININIAQEAQHHITTLIQKGITKPETLRKAASYILYGAESRPKQKRNRLQKIKKQKVQRNREESAQGICDARVMVIGPARKAKLVSVGRNPEPKPKRLPHIATMLRLDLLP